MSAYMDYLDGNAAAGELTRIFTADLTSAEGECANCGARMPFAEAHLYMQCPGLVARCALCGHVLLRLASSQGRVVLDLRGMTYVSVESTEQEAGNQAHGNPALR